LKIIRIAIEWIVDSHDEKTHAREGDQHQD